VIELLQEKRTALVMQAVTKGLHPSVLMKDSGVEWLGEIPAHWRVTKMWDVAVATSGGTPAKEDLRYWDGGIPWVSPKDMKRRFIDSSEDTVSAAAVSESGLKLVANPAVLVVVRGMILAHSFPVGVTKVPVTINQDMKALRLRNDVDPEFFGYWLEGVGPDLLAVLVDEAAHGTKAIRMDRWRVTPVEIPPEDEQRIIVAFLDRETLKIDALVGRVRDAVTRLKELRTALIAAAVTGKIDVRNDLDAEGIQA
jgi:type I restriction enzyme S subunit